MDPRGGLCVTHGRRPVLRHVGSPEAVAAYGSTRATPIASVPFSVVWQPTGQAYFYIVWHANSLATVVNGLIDQGFAILGLR